MPDNNTQLPKDNPNSSKTTNSANNQTSSTNTETKNENEQEPTLEEDYESLKQMHLLKNVMIRMQYGRYPNKKIDDILKRRMDFDESKYQGPTIVRAILTIMAMFFICSFLYIIIWLISSSLNLNNLKETASLVLSLFFLGSCGFAIFNNLSVPDEKKLKEAIKERMTEIEKELKTSSNENDKSNSEKQSQTNNNNTK